MSSGSGDRNEIVTVERETRTIERGGGAGSAWSAIGELWADVQFIGSSETQRFGSIRATRKYRFVVNAFDAEDLGVTTGDRLVWNGELFGIQERPRFQSVSPDMSIIAESGITQ